MSKRRILVSALRAGALALAMTVAGLHSVSAASAQPAAVSAQPAAAEDPTPSCAGRGETFGQVLNAGNTVYYTVGLNECDTLRLRNWLAAGAATGGACSAITKWVKIVAPPYKAHAEVADAICATLGTSSGASALLLNQRNDAGGKCGVVIELTGIASPNIADPLGDSHTVLPSSLTVRGQRCQPGVAPKDVDKPRYVRKPAATPGEIVGLEKVPLDLAFVIDNTYSMADSISEVKAAATSLIDDTNWAWAKRRILVATYNDPSAELRSGFSADPAAATGAINGITVYGGGDTPEAVFSGLMTAIDASWRANSLKSIILMGDAAPHDPENGTGYTTASVTAAANAVPPQGVPINGVLLGADSAASAAFTSLATATGGGVYTAADSSGIVEQLLNALAKSGTERP